MNRAFRNLVALQFKEFFREPEIIFWAFILPIVLTWLLGVAIGSGGGVAERIALIEDAESPAGAWEPWIAEAQRALRDAEAPGDRRAGEKGDGIKFVVMSREEAILALKKGRIALFIERRPASEGIRYSFDPRNGEARTLWLTLDRALAGGGSAGSSVVSLDVQGTRYIDFLVPGLIAMDIMNSALWGIGWVLIEIRIKKLLRRMAATPMSKALFLFSHFVTRLIVNALEFVALFLFAYFYFGLKVQGSIPALVAVFVAGNMAFTGIAIFCSSRTANPRVGNGLINAIVFPMTLLSGIFFSYHHFPDWAVPIVRALPLTMLADSMRAVFNEGAGFAQVGLPIVVLAGIGAFFFAIGKRVYKWY